MSRRYSIVCTMIVFASFVTVFGCSGSANPNQTIRTGAAGMHATPHSLGSWTTKASMPTARGYLAVGVVNGILYAVGGYGPECGNPGFCNRVEAYDPSTDTWTTKASMPTPRQSLAVGVVNGILYAVGGYGPACGNLGVCNTVEAYDPSTDTWTTKTSMPTPRTSLAVGVVNAILYAVGGDNGHYLNTVEAYDPSTDTWTTKASMPTARLDLGASVLGRRLYAVGGRNHGGPKSTVQAYDPATNTWTGRAPMPLARGGLATRVDIGKLYAVGGFDIGDNPLNTVEAYDPATNSWTTKATMPTARAHLAAGVVNGILYAVGGFNGVNLDTVEAFNPR